VHVIKKFARGRFYWDTVYTKSAKNWKTIAVHCRQLYFRFVVILRPEFETAKFSTNTGITPKSNENSELKRQVYR